MKKILLIGINAKYIHSNPAVYSLKAYCEQKWAEVSSFPLNHQKDDFPVRQNENDKTVYPHPELEIAEYTINQIFDDILGDIYQKRPDVVAFSCYLWNIDFVRSLSRELKKVLPDVMVWLGGPEVSFDAPLVLHRQPEVDLIICGEGEKPFFALCQFLAEYQQASSQEFYRFLAARFQKAEGEFEVQETRYQDAKLHRDDSDHCVIFENDDRNLYFRFKSEKMSKPIPATTEISMRAITDTRDDVMMDDIPFIYDDLSRFTHKIVYYESSCGCPYGCTYCLSSVSKNVRFRSLGQVMKHIQYFLDQNVAQVKFVDRTFNCSHERTKAIFQYLLEHDNGLTNFHFEIAGDLLTKEEIHILHQMRPGLVQLEIGVQTVNPDTICAIHRTMNLEKLKANVISIKEKQNVHQHLDLIAGLPYEDRNSFIHSFDVVYSLQPEQLQLGFLKVLKGSYMQQCAKEYSLVYQSRPPYEVLSTKWLSYDDILSFKKIEQMVEIYYNSRLYPDTMAYWGKFFSSPFSLFEVLVRYYEEKDLFDRKHSRIARYTILHDCIQQWCQTPMDVLPNKNKEKKISLLKEQVLYSQAVLPEEAKNDRILVNPTQAAKTYDILRQLLIMDLYQHEPLKTRPFFAGDEKETNRLKKSILEQKNELSHHIHIEKFSTDVMNIITEKIQPLRIEPEKLTDYFLHSQDRLNHSAPEQQLQTSLSSEICYVLFDYEQMDAFHHTAKRYQLQ